MEKINGKYRFDISEMLDIQNSISFIKNRKLKLYESVYMVEIIGNLIGNGWTSKFPYEIDKLIDVLESCMEDEDYPEELAKCLKGYMYGYIEFVKDKWVFNKQKDLMFVDEKNKNKNISEYLKAVKQYSLMNKEAQEQEYYLDDEYEEDEEVETK